MPESIDRVATRSLAGPVARPLQTAGHLIVVDGATSRRVALPHRGVLVVGRASDADVRIEGQSVSRRHAEIVVADGEVRVDDLGSHNGTYVNGEATTGSRILASGDTVLLGEVALLYRRASDEAGPRKILDRGAIDRRVGEELARMRATERPFTVVVLGGDDGGAAAAGSPARRLEGLLHPLDAVAAAGDGTLLIVLPERGRDEAVELAERLVAAVADDGVVVRAGCAVAPDDAQEAAALWDLARAACRGARPGTVGDAGSIESELAFGERRVVVADPAMVRIYELLRRLAASDLPVLIQGETGVGKENAAFAVHWCSPRRSGPFVAVNCAAFTESLVESELFGHEKGAFSGAVTSKTGLFEAAHGGTLFLDEVGELSPTVQAKLLRVLELKRLTRVGGLRELPVDLRVVAATNRDLEADVAAGRFRRDLYFRLGAASVQLPPLRERPREIVLLARRFLAAACARLDRPPVELSTRAVLALGRWRWPGNVRELRNLMDYLGAAVIEAVIEPWHLPEAMVSLDEPGEAGEVAAGPTPRLGPPHPGRPLVDEVREFERRLLVEALAACDGVRVRAAERLGLPLRTFKYKLKQHGITGGAVEGSTKR